MAAVFASSFQVCGLCSQLVDQSVAISTNMKIFLTKFLEQSDIPEKICLECFQGANECVRYRDRCHITIEKLSKCKLANDMILGRPVQEPTMPSTEPDPIVPENSRIFQTFAEHTDISNKKMIEDLRTDVEDLRTKIANWKTWGEELSFNGKGLKLTTAQDAQIVTDQITNYSKGKMKVLILSGNTIGIDAAKEIGKALESRPELERARWSDMFTGRTKDEIPHALKHMSDGVMKAGAQLVELDISDNAIGPIGVKGVVELIKSASCHTLKELKLNNTGCGAAGGKLLAKSLLEGYHKSVRINQNTPFGLLVFMLGRSCLEDEGAKALAEVFSLMGTLEEVVIPQNGIHRWCALSFAFGNNPNLRVLNINDNTVTEQSPEYLAVSIKKLKHLERINVGDCLLKTEGAKVIAEALKESGAEKLREVYMDSNEIKEDGGLAIVDLLKTCCNLNRLMLDGNHFGDEGCKKILKKLKESDKGHIMENFEDDQGSDGDGQDEICLEGYQGSDEETENEVGASNGATIFDQVPSNSESSSSTSIFGKNWNSTGKATTGNEKKGIDLSANNDVPSFALFSSNNKPLLGVKIEEVASNGATIFDQVPSNSESSSSTSIFGGGATGKATTGNEKKGIDLSANKDLPSFASLSSNNKPLFAVEIEEVGASNGATIVDKVSSNSGSSSSTSIFGGGAPGEATTGNEKKGIDLSSNKDLPTFASFSSNDRPLFGERIEGFSFAGAGRSIFRSGNNVTNGNTIDENDESQAEDNEHDPHFEPIIPLPELVDVTTGEEDEKEIFKHRAKVYRFDTETKEWKERGVGDIKILKHSERLTNRVLFRRDQTYKVACNHMITKDMILKPMASSETALCWNAIDHADGDAKTEQLAVKFKLVETKNDFKAAFEKATEDY